MNPTHCTSCGADLLGGRFCGECGAEATPLPGHCPVCSSAQPPGSRFCADCGAQVGRHDRTSAPGAIAPHSGPAGSKSVRARRPWLVMGIVVACVLVAASAGLTTYLLTGADEAPAVTLEPVGFTRADSFMGNLDTDVEGARRAPRENESTRFDVIDDPRQSRVTTSLSGQVAGGSAPGLYGGTRDTAVCDVEALVDFLTDDANAARAAAWAGVLGIRVDEIPEYVRGLTAARLSFDTRVTNHGFAEGGASAYQSLLQAGTAVLVDRSGVPRVSCGCGNPLLEPAELGEESDHEEALELDGAAQNPAQAWEGLDPQRAVTIQPASRPVDAITLLDRENADGLLERPVGSTGVNMRDTGTGDVKVTLEWESDADLDLHVVEPDGTEIMFSQRGPTATGGELDVDANVGCEQNGSLENVFWPPGEAPAGEYRVEVNGFSVDGCGGGDFTLTIQVAGQEPRVERGSVSDGEDVVFTFTSAGPERGSAPAPSPAESSAERLGAASTITTQGLGPVLAGMTVEEAQAAAGTPLAPIGESPNGGCQYFEAEGLPGVSFMTMRGEIARVDVNEATVKTVSGLTLGASETDVEEKYGTNVERTQHEYDPDGSYLTYVPDDPEDETRLVFETDGSEVTLIRAGRLPEVEYVEGCS